MSKNSTEIGIENLTEIENTTEIGIEKLPKVDNISEIEIFHKSHPTLTRRECKLMVEATTDDVSSPIQIEMKADRPVHEHSNFTRAVFRHTSLPINNAKTLSTVSSTVKRITTQTPNNPMVNITSGAPFVSVFATNQNNNGNLKSI